MVQYHDMDTLWLMVLVILLGSAISLIGGATIFLAKKRRNRAIQIALPLGAGALLAAAFFDLLPESFEHGEPRLLLLWTLVGFTTFFLFERLATWFHHHHEHQLGRKNESQNRMVVIGDLLHNMIDGVAIAAAFIANPLSGIVTTLAVSAHEIPKELGTFGILLSRGWGDRKVMFANLMTAVGTLVVAVIVYFVGQATTLPLGPLLAATAGMFIYIAASDIIPDIHEQSRRVGTWQAAILVASMCRGSWVMRWGARFARVAS
jgi:zinc and cadmium transporter